MSSLSSTDGPTSPTTSGTLVGEIVAGHELVRCVGAGGMGEVYLAKHRTLGVIRAVKLIRADLRLREDALARFTREAQVLSRLQHESIVQIIEAGALESGWPFLVMEYIEGPNLGELVERGPLPVPNALVVLEQMALALHHAHSHSVIHRDLKPSNVLVRSGDIRQVKVIDFGFARVLDVDGTRLTADGEQIGSPLYIAPEQVEGARDVTAAADVYALACIAYLLVSGNPPFRHRKRMRLMAAHVNEVPERLSERCPAVPAFFDDLVARCLAKDPAARPTAGELATQLGEHVRGMTLDLVDTTSASTVERVESSWEQPEDASEIIAQLLETPVPQDPEGLGLALATKVMSIIEEIVTYLSASDPELSSLLQLEARICEQRATVESELATVRAQLVPTPDAPALLTQRNALLERIRTLDAQQLPLQRRMVEVVEAYRQFATGPMRLLFRQMDSARHQLNRLRQQSS